MGDGNKKWEDRSSREGLGILQDLKGVPNSAFLTNGELSLKQQERIATSLESVLSRIPTDDYRTIARGTDNIEVQERVHESIVAGLQDQFAQLRGAEFERDLSVGRQNREQSAMAGAMYDSLEELRYSSEGIAGGIGDLNETAIGIRNEMSGIGQGVGAIHQTQLKQSEFLGKIADSIETYGSNTDSMLHRLADLAMEQIRSNAEEQGLNRQEMRRVTGLAVGQIMMGLQQLGGSIGRGFDSLREATVDVRNSVDRVGSNVREVRDEVRRNTDAQLYVARNSEAIKAVQYLNQGRALLANGHVRDAIERLNIAFSLNKVDFETSMLLATAYGILNDRRHEQKHLDVAGSFSAPGAEKAQQNVGYAKHEKAKGNVDNSIEKAIVAIKNAPGAYYSDLQEVFGGIDVRDRILLPLLERYVDDIDIQGLCAVELAVRGDLLNARRAIGNILKRFSRDNFNSEIYGKMMMNLHLISPVFKDVIDKEGQAIEPIGLLRFAGMLITGNQEIELARRYIMQVYRTDQNIATMRRTSNYRGIVDYLKSFLGTGIVALKRFLELPLEIRRLV